MAAGCVRESWIAGVSMSMAKISLSLLEWIKVMTGG